MHDIKLKCEHGTLLVIYSYVTTHVHICLLSADPLVLSIFTVTSSDTGLLRISTGCMAPSYSSILYVELSKFIKVATKIYKDNYTYLRTSVQIYTHTV